MTLPSTTLQVGATLLTLDGPLLWQDEFAWSPVTQRVRPTLTGALDIQLGERQAGRPVTLASGSWVRRAQLLQLQAWADQAGLVVALSVRGEPARSALWAHERGPALSAEMVQPHAAADDGDHYRVTARFTLI
jgi:hypothetical protein